MKIIAAQKGKGKQKKKILLHISISSIKCKKTSKNTELFGINMIMDQFRDGWHKFINNLFVGQIMKHYSETDGTNKS